MSGVSLSNKQPWRRRRDEHDNVIVDLLVNDTGTERNTYFLNLENLKKAYKFDLKRQTSLLVRRLAKNGAFQSFPIGDQKRAELYGQIPKGYEVDFFIPLTIGGSYSIENLCIISKDLCQLMQDLYWKPLSLEIKRFLHKKDEKKNAKIGIRMPIFPQVFSQRSFLNFVLPEEREALEKYLARKKAWRLSALKRVVVRERKDYFVLRLLYRQRLPKGMKYALVKAQRISLLESAKVKQAYLREKEQLVLASLERGDFDFLPKKVRETIKKTGHIPSNVDLTCHHVIPRALGGENRIENVCWLSRESHDKLHQAFINPLIEYCDFLSEDKKKRDIYIEIPVPEDAQIPRYILTRRLKVSPVTLPKKFKKGPEVVRTQRKSLTFY